MEKFPLPCGEREKASPKGYDVITSATIMVKSEKEDNLR